MTTPLPPAAGRVLESPVDIRALLEQSHRIAVLGIKIEPIQPAHYVPQYAQRAGYDVVPVPVYYPEVTEILGRPVFRRLVDVPGEIDIVNVFRRPQDIPPHLPDILAKAPRAVWFQLGIRHDAAARELTAAGIDVVQDRCLMVDLRRIGR
jgi:predicted CoA-binding protein